MTDSNSQAAALAWATDTFRHFSRQLEKGSLRKNLSEDVAAFLEFYDHMGEAMKLQNPLASGSPPTSPFLKEFLRKFSAELLERDGQLPQPLAEFAAASLREPNIPRAPGPKTEDLFVRNVFIGMVVQNIVKVWGFSRTRNRLNTDGVCAVSITKQALANAVNINLSEDDIIKASDKFADMAAHILPVLAKQGEKIMEFFSGRVSPEAEQLVQRGGVDLPEVMARFQSELQNNPEFKEVMGDPARVHSLFMSRRKN